MVKSAHNRGPAHVLRFRFSSVLERQPDPAAPSPPISVKDAIVVSQTAQGAPEPLL